jgi:hypothetical protein
MKRDMELIRLLLIQQEGETKPDLSGYTQEQIIYHGALLIEAELVHGNVHESMNGLDGVFLDRLTWQGHEFLDAARNEVLWKKVRDASLKIGGGLTLPLAKALLAKYAKELLGLDVT